MYPSIAQPDVAASPLSQAIGGSALMPYATRILS